jgi:hypothetical protein
MEADTEDQWWTKHDGENAQDEEDTESSDSENYVIAYNKSPFVGALPWIVGLAFASLIVLAQLTALSGAELIGMGCISLFFLFAFSAVLLTNEELGVRISVNTEKALIDVAHRGLMTELKTKSRIKYGSSDHIQLNTRYEETTSRDSDGNIGTATATYHDIQLFRSNGSRKTIFSTNGPLISRGRAQKIGKSIARITGLDYR